MLGAPYHRFRICPHGGGQEQSDRGSKFKLIIHTDTHYYGETICTNRSGRVHC